MSNFWANFIVGVCSKNTVYKVHICSFFFRNWDTLHFFLCLHFYFYIDGCERNIGTFSFSGEIRQEIAENLDCSV